MTAIINPTVGRKVWFFESAAHAKQFADGDHSAQPYDATILFVHDARCVNISYFTHVGSRGFAPGIALVQEGDAPANGPHCQWMPYQQKQATKAEIDEKLRLASDGSTVNQADAIVGKDAKALMGDALNDGGGESLSQPYGQSYLADRDAARKEVGGESLEGTVTQAPVESVAAKLDVEQSTATQAAALGTPL